MRSVSSDTLRQLARLDLSPEWEVRLVDQDSRVWPIPPGAIKGRQRSTELDGSTWRLSLSLDRSLLPSGVDPLQYHKIEIDLLLGSDTIPYFRGIIDHPQGGESLQGGAIAEPLELEALGMLQKTKGVRVISYRNDPTVQTVTPAAPTFLLTLLGRTERWTPGGSVAAGVSESLPSGVATIDADTYLKVYTDSTLATIYTKGTDYTIDLTAKPVKINWINAPLSSRVVEFARLERVVYLKTEEALGAFTWYVVIPYGRSYDDIYQTTIASVSPHPTNQVTPSDPAGWKDYSSGYVTITQADGTETLASFSRVSAVTGEISVGAAITADMVGCQMRMSTAEYFQAWDEDRPIKFYNGPGAGTEWNRRYLRAVPSLGYAQPVEPRNWTEQVYSDMAYVREDVDANRIEEVIKTLLTATGIYTSGEVTTEYGGVYVKNAAFHAIDLDELLAAMAKNLLPNEFIHDEPDGTISIKPYRQATEPDWVMRGAHEIQETDHPEPITAVTVIAEGDEYNIAGKLFHASSNFTNPERVIDGNKTISTATKAAATVTTSSASLTFRIPITDPLTAYPTIEKIRVTGEGLLSAYITRSGTNYYIPGFNFAPLPSGGAEITKEDLHRALHSTTDAYQDLVLVFDPATDGDTLPGTVVGTGACCSEVEIITKQAGAWRATLTDDTAYADADNGADEFGSVWTQIDISKRESWRYAPSEYIKRTSTRYYAPGGATAAKPRHLVLRFQGISQQAARDYAERWLDYKLMEGKTYTVSGLLDPRAQLGDTVRIFRKDGTYLDLFLWGISDGGGPDDLGCTYTMKDYA